MKTARIEFEYNGWDVVARGTVLSEDEIKDLTLSFKGVPKNEYPIGEELVLIRDEAFTYLVDKVYYPELDFDV